MWWLRLSEHAWELRIPPHTCLVRSGSLIIVDYFNILCLISYRLKNVEDQSKSTTTTTIITTTTTTTKA
uniref:Uncharacterized protein n=1 Tax=Rhizophora mucronata TaxID=61149 RepID=A0A2P2MAB4_RHIMU